MMSIVTFLAIIVPFGWLCTQLVAFGNLFSEITGITFTVLIIIFAAISMIFVLPGGLTSVAWSDFLFGCVMVVMSLACGIYMLRLGVGWSEITANVLYSMVGFLDDVVAV